MFLVFYVSIDSTKSRLSKLIACIKTINFTIFPSQIYTLYPISHLIERSLRKRGNRGGGHHETSKLLKVRRYGYVKLTNLF